jgi:hypothetical protein
MVYVRAGSRKRLIAFTAEFLHRIALSVTLTGGRGQA